MRSISSRQNPIVRAFRALRANPPDDGARLVLDGAHLVRDAHAAGLRFEQVAVSVARLANGSEIASVARELSRDGVEVVAVSDPVMKALSPVRTPAGIVAIARRPPAALATICAHPRALVAAAVDVQDPGNLGALLRAAEAAGATGAAVCGVSAHPFSWKAVRGSMGSVLRLPVVAGLEAHALLAVAKKAGLRRIASVAQGGDPPDAVDWRARTLLVIGGEGRGLDADLLDACDERVTVPMAAPVESLNVAVAAALLLYEARRRRQLPE